MPVAACSGGTSGPRPGFSLAQYITPAVLGASLNNVPTWQAVAFGAAIGALSFDLSTFCLVDPPPMPTWSAGDLLALLAPIPTPARQVAANKLYDFAANIFWPQFCECTAGAPVPPVFPTAPAGAPTVQTTQPGLGSPVICGSSGGPGQNTESFPGGNTIGRFNPIAASASALQVFAGYTHTGIGPHQPTSILLAWNDAGGNRLSTPTYLLPADGITRPYVFSIPTGATDVIVDIDYAALSTDTFESYVFLLCGGSPGQSSACCPPDTTAQNQIQAILDMVTLIQRQIVPFGYVPGTVHSGLTGDGTIAISDLVGFKVHVTATPPAAGFRGADPAYYFNLGWLTWGAPDGYDQSIRLQHLEQLSTPPRASVFETIGYQLEPGVTIDLTELVREP